MLRKFGLAIAAAVLAGGAFALGTPAAQAQSGVSAGTLSCNVEGGWGFVFGSSNDIRCTYSGPGVHEHYAGHINTYGVDIGYTQEGVIIWGVFAPTAQVGPGALSGEYVGATAGAAVGVGVGGNVLVGGSNRSISLQPLSVSGSTGLNIAGGIGAITLRLVP